ncbi:MAG: type II secretion system protein [Burkholderiales bacterium]|nr:type II secretion system protein [Burkholderiales bacterium]
MLEVTVVMVLISMVSYLAFEMLAQASRADARVSEHLKAGRNAGMRMEWFRLLVQGIYADKDDPLMVFKGDGRKMEGLSTMAPTVDQGRLVHFSIELADVGDDTQLLYKETGGAKENKPVTLLSWPRDSHAAWIYVADTGARYDQWPPVTFVGKPDSSAPSVILLKRVVDGQPEVLSFVPKRFSEKPADALSLLPLT